MISLLLSAWALQEAELQAGVEAYRAGDHARAAGHFEASIQRKESAEAWANLGHARAVLRENAAARKAFARALELGPQDRARVSLALGRICLLENDPRAAVEAFAGALDGAETAADAWRGMARARELLKDRSGAIDAYRQAAARHPKDDALQARLAHLLLEARRGEEALDVL